MTLNSFIVFDFETTGLSPAGGDRAIEIGAVKVANGEIADRFQMLMNPGVRVNSFIESYTGITNSMLSQAAPNAQSMKMFLKFIGKTPLIAHNASFDKKFLDSELKLINEEATQTIACSLRVARRLYQDAPNHKLQTLIKLNNIPVTGDFHRALADAEMTARLWMKMSLDLASKYQIKHVDYNLMYSLSLLPKKKIESFIKKIS